MAHKLIGREIEIEIIDKAMQSDQSEFIAVYGRRRVGKTFLIRQYLSANMVFDFTGTKDGTIKEQLANFFDEYKKRASGKRETVPPSTWQEAFKYLASYIKKNKKIKTKQVIFIDEMPWLDTKKSGFKSAMAFFWNQHISALDNVVLVACGSASSWIKKELIEARGDLYNRVTCRIQLLPFSLYETELFIQSLGVPLSKYQILELYMAMGGIPFYLREITKGKSSAQLIDKICFSPQGLLKNEYAQLYHSLFKNAEVHVKIIEILAAFPQGISRLQIAIKSKLSEGTLSRALQELVECDFVTIYSPFLNRKKESIYKLTDLYSLFYLKFIKGNKKSGSGTWTQLSKQTAYKAWSGYAFENICMLHTNQIKAALGISGVFSTNNSWKFAGNNTLPGAQIDMIIDRADQIINLCEAKFTRDNFIITKSYAAQLRLKKTIFNQVTKTKKTTFNTLITTHPALKNQYYMDEIDNEITMDKLFNPA